MSKTKKIILIVALGLIVLIMLGAFAMAFNAEKLFWRTTDKVANFFDDLIPDKKPHDETAESDSESEEEGKGLQCSGAETTPGFGRLYPAC